MKKLSILVTLGLLYLITMSSLTLVSANAPVNWSKEHQLSSEIAAYQNDQLAKIDPDTQEYKAVYLTEGIKEKYGFDFVYTPDQSWELPVDFLAYSTTDELAMAVFANPNMNRITCFSDYEVGFAMVFDEFNGIRALLSRSDVGLALTRLYTSLSIPMEELPTTLIENYMIIESLDVAMNLPPISSVFSSAEKRAIQAKAEHNFVMRSRSVYTADFFVKTAIEMNSDLMFDLNDENLQTVKHKVFVPISSETTSTIRSLSSDNPSWWNYSHFAYQNGYLYTKDGYRYQYQQYLQDFSDATRRTMDALMKTNYGMDPIYKSTGNASATVMYNCHAYSLDNYRFYSLGNTNAHINYSTHTGFRAQTSDALTDSGFQYGVYPGDILLDNGHSMKVVANGWNLQVRDKWDSKGEYQYVLGVRTPYYTPNTSSSPGTPYPLTAYYLK